MAVFRPRYQIKRVYQLTPQQLAAWGVKALLLDVDNTLTTHGNPVPEAAVLSWISQMQESGIRLMLLSNNSKARVAPFAQVLGLNYESSAAKPFSRGFARCCKRLQLPKAAVAIVGDQIFTDILGGNLFGMKTVLTEPIELEKGILFFIKRVVEAPFIKAYRK